MKKRVCLLFLFVLVSTAIYNYGAIPASERAALIALYNSMDGDHWWNNRGWKTPPLAADGFAMPGTEGNWLGIGVTGDTVLIISLEQNKVQATLPSELANLPNLQSLCICYSGISGPIPPELGKLSNLQDLDLQGNSLNGSIPAELGNLSHLQDICLLQNQLSGPIPVELGNLSNLHVLHLGMNQLNGPIPSTLGNLSNLRFLGLECNQLSGPIPPELGKLSHLQILYLFENLLSGIIPPELGNLSKLEELDISSCLLSGNIPPELGNLRHLNFLSLSENQLSGPIPATLGNLWASLQILGLSKNQLSGPIPATLGKLHVETLNLKNNQLSGPIPPELGNLPGVNIFFISHNQLSGEIPFNIIHLDTYSFDISYNCLYTNDPVLRKWLKAKQPSWEDHQDQCPALTIVLNRSHLYFGAKTGGSTSAPQTVIIKKNSTRPLAWTAVSDSPWLNVSPTSGTDCGIITIAVNPSGLSVGTFTGAISINAPNADNSPQTVPVTLRIYDNGTTTIPFGDFATPLNGSTVSGSIPVTGWVLDDIEVKKVEIFSDTSYIGDAVFIEGARPDVEEAYPNYPLNYKAGWGYMLLTHFFPNGGNGTYAIYSVATDVEGNRAILGLKKINCNNANAVEPFGAIDTPIQAGIASGKDFVNLGWALTPQPHIINVNRFTIDVWIDGVSIGNATYGLFREDIARLFPGYANSNGAGGVFRLDTTRFRNGMHTIHWTIHDNSYNFAGIGSRYFTIMNSGNTNAQESFDNTFDMPIMLTSRDSENLPEQTTSPGKVIKGYVKDDETCGYELFPDEDGINRVCIKELERIEIRLSKNHSDVADVDEVADVRGYMIINGGLRPLPIGSTLDKKAGKFYWSPGPGFYGKYDLVFLIKDSDGQWSKKRIEINIGSKYALND